MKKPKTAVHKLVEEEGRDAARNGEGWGACPYPNNTEKRQAWAWGFVTERDKIGQDLKGKNGEEN